MAESQVNHLLIKLAQFVENEVWHLTGGQEEALSVRGELERVRAFLRVADSLEESDDEVKVWVKQLRNTAYEMEDALDEFSLILRHDHGVGFTGLISRMSCCIRNLKARYRVTSEIKRIHYRVKVICEGHKRLHHKFSRAQQELGAYNSWQDHRGNSLLLDRTDLVGIEQPKNELVVRLLDHALRREVISVVGMGGLGKTTLVKQVYDDPAVKKHFTVYAWITLSRAAKSEELLKDMLNQIMRVIRKPVPPGANTMNSHWLKMIIKDLLQRRRYLIVLDDAWHINEWDAVKHAFPNNSHGSRVIITTRNADLASTSCKEFNGLVKNMEPLDPEQSWKLFCRKTFQGNSCPSHLEEICKFILRKCEGLPLAIVAISGVLAAKDKRRIDEWDVVRRSLRAEIDGNDRLKNLKRVLSLSFGDLPYYLKSCFLHLSVFPEGYLIERRRLIRLWVAEGFVERKEGKTLEEVAEDYFRELLNRSLIQVAETTTDGRFTFCRIHDFQREIITSKSQDQSFATIAKEPTDMWPDKVRRLSLHNSLQAAQQNRSLSHLRSLYMFGVDRASIDIVLGSDIKLLNVLDLQATPLPRFPVQVVDWYYLTYLSFRHTDVKTIPASIGKLQNLETLDLKHTNVTRLPVEILKLQKLKHLLVYRYENISYLCYKYGFKALTEIGALQSLQKLCHIEADDERSHIIMRELGKLTQLSRLSILKLRKEDGRALCSSITKLTNLRAISVASIEDNEILDLQHLTSPPQLLQRIYLKGRLKMLPNWLATLHSLVKLHLRWSRLKDDPLVSLQSLPNLVHLELLQVYEGKTLCFKAKGFRKLRILGLDNFDELRSVEVEEGAMPCLEKLIIQRCKLLEKLPSGIEYLTKLKVLEFFDMPDELVKKFVQDEHDMDYQKVAHIPEVYYGYWRDGGWDVQSIERSSEGDASPHQGTSMRSSQFPPCWK
ncbi:disease resistance protein RPM1-like [Rhodamnia argentea]|uniref:Disease resistance protein RPM1-like n=1 Tax=Rhodamnia argentea TaxID=178133 RepID=A0A8B8N4E8_9MYRT|nr:disease resistance protein RPM1-like [Rhodamnia argentea]